MLRSEEPDRQIHERDIECAKDRQSRCQHLRLGAVGKPPQHQVSEADSMPKVPGTHQKTKRLLRPIAASLVLPLQILLNVFWRPGNAAW